MAFDNPQVVLIGDHTYWPENIWLPIHDCRKSVEMSIALYTCL